MAATGFFHGAVASPALSAAPKPLINSQALQDAISIDRLLASAQDLYEVANLSWPEYNHPTRVIGSKGDDCFLMARLERVLTNKQVISERWTTSASPSPASMITTKGHLRPSRRTLVASSSSAWFSVMMWPTPLLR